MLVEFIKKRVLNLYGLPAGVTKNGSVLNIEQIFLVLPNGNERSSSRGDGGTE